MKIGYVKKGLTIGIIILFVFVGISSAVAFKGVKINNNNIINSSNIVSTEDLPDLKVVDIYTIGWSIYPYETFLTCVTFRNIGNASIHEDVNFVIFLYRGWLRSFIPMYTFGPSSIKLDLAPGDRKEYDFIHGVWPFPPFCRLKVYVNYDKKVNESDYSNNIAVQRFYIPIFVPGAPDWIRIGRISYPSLVPHQLGI